MPNKLILFLLFASQFSFAQDSLWHHKKDCITIPFELTDNLIIIDVLLNETPLKMILDTGADQNILFTFPTDKEVNLLETKKTKIVGLGMGESFEGLLSNNNVLKIKEYEQNSFDVLVIIDSNISLINKLGIEINGIIGYSFFENHLVEINYSQQKIRIYKDKRILDKRKQKKYNKIPIEIKNRKPYLTINTTINNKKLLLKLLLDTGFGDGLWLFENNQIHTPTTHIEDVLGLGLGGEIKGKRARIEQISWLDVDLEDVLVAFPDSTMFQNLAYLNHRNGTLGGEITKRFNLFLDYQSQHIYFKPNKKINEPFNYNMSGIEIQHSGVQLVVEESSSNNGSLIKFTDDRLETTAPKINYKYTLNPVYVITSVRENSPAALAGLQKDDILLTINNTKAYKYNIQKINELLQQEDGKKMKMEIERKGEKKTYQFVLKKLI